MFKTEIYVTQYPDVDELLKLTADVIQNLPFSQLNNEIVWRRPPFPTGTESTSMHAWLNNPKHPPEFLHQREDFKNIVAFIEHHAKNYWVGMGYDKTITPYLDNCWAMRYAGHAGGLDNHNHPNIPIAGAMYFDACPEQGNLVFQDPLDLMLSMNPYLPWSRNSRLKDVDVTTGKLILFPGWLNHSVMPNKTDKPRYNISLEIKAGPKST
jgi:uncharacterized protein (TIGR02466 family)